MSWLGTGWRLFWRLLYVFLPFSAFFSIRDLLEVKVGSEIPLIKLTLGLVRLKFALPFPHGLSPWLQGLIVFGEVIFVPLLWILALYFGFLKLRNQKLGEGMRTFFYQLPILFRAYVLFALRVLLGLLLFVIPGIVWGLSWMFGPLIVLVGDSNRDPFATSETITRGRRGRLFLLFLGLVILDEIGRFGTVNIAFYSLPAAAAFGALYRLFLNGLALGAVLAAFIELSQQDIGRFFGLPAVSVEKPSWNWAQVTGGLTSGMALVGVTGYLACSVASLWDPLKPLPPLDLPDLPPISRKADLILGTEYLDAMAPGPGEGEITLATPGGLEIRSVPDLALVRFIPVDIPSFTYAVALSPTGKEAVLTGYHFTLLVRLSDGAVLWQLDLPGSSVAFNPSGDVIAVGHGNQVSLLDSRTGDEIVTFVEKSPVLILDSVINRWGGRSYTDELEVEHISFSPDGSLLAVSMKDLNVRNFYYAVLKVPSGEVLQRHRGFATFSPDGELVVAHEHYLSCLDPLTGKERFSLLLPEKKGWIVTETGAHVAVNANGDKFALCEGGNLYLIDRREGDVSVHSFPTVKYSEPVRIRLGPVELFIPWAKLSEEWCVGPVEELCFINDHVLFVNCDRLHVFGLRTGRYVKTLFFSGYASNGPTRPLSICAQRGISIVVPSRAHMMNLYSLPEGIPKMAVPIEEPLVLSFPVVASSPEGDAVAVGTMYDGAIEVHSCSRWQLKFMAKGLRGPLGWWRGKVFVSNGSCLSFLDPKTGSIQTSSLPLRISHDAGWDLDGDRLAVFDRNTGEVRVIDVAGKEKPFSSYFLDLTSALFLRQVSSSHWDSVKGA